MNTIQDLVSIFGGNMLFIQDMYESYNVSPSSINPDWKRFFDDFSQGRIDPGKFETQVPNQPKPDAIPSLHSQQMDFSLTESIPVEISEGDITKPLAGVFLKIVENMQRSLSVPTATSLRTMAVKLLEENRLLINQFLESRTGKKVAFTHIIAYAIVQALKRFPSINSIYGIVEGKPCKIMRSNVNIGLAIDVERKDGSRSLVVPNIKQVDKMTFADFLHAYNDIISKARTNKLTPEDFRGTTVSLSNPGTIGTVSSIPRLMAGQGAILAVGSIQYTAEHQAMSPDMLAQLGISKVMTMTNTYDHRVIQGAESGEFLAYINDLLLGKDNFYKNIFKDTKAPFLPWSYKLDKPSVDGIRRRNDDAPEKQVFVSQMINAYRVRGHLMANLDPLEMTDVIYHVELDPEYYGLTIWDLDRYFTVAAFGRNETMKLRDIIINLRNTYCQHIGIEYTHMQDTDKKRWITEHVELDHVAITQEDRIQALKNLIRAELFEKFIHTKFLGHKRFSLEGGESTLVCLDETLQHLTKFGGKEVVLGMAHRGRLNVLCNIVGKSYEKLFTEFEGKSFSSDGGSGDVKYHLGAVGKKVWETGEEISVSVASNPSHLEAVNPVVGGIVRAKQDRLKRNGETNITDQVISVLIHGDAAFIGQGVVAETLNMSELRAYSVGGTIHLIVNNQIGFTTLPRDSRSTTYASDIAKFVQAPIFHVNGDDIESCLKAARLAVEFRATFHCDVVVDIVCYRKYGHNEGDDPTYTQPLMYEKIKSRPSVLTIYSSQLIRQKSITESQYHALLDEFKYKLDDALEKAKAIPPSEVKIERKADLTLAVKHEELLAKYRAKQPATAVTLQLLQQVTKAMFRYPENFKINSKLSDQLEKRKLVLQNERTAEVKLDWGFAECLALGTLCEEHVAVRFCGQDTRRGTFSQRHLELYDIVTGKEYIPLSNISATQAPLYVYNSHLSEYAALGFEYGYSVADPLTLTVWEAQFGDFVNGAQIIIDQFISSAESKWGQPSGIVLLLPHGFEGQGPEHSSGRVERFLQLCAEVNIQVCNCTTPSQYFHLLRRQIMSGNIKPLVVMSPKSLLRHPMATSSVNELTEGRFHNVLDDVELIQSPQRVALCTGKVYYDLMAKRNQLPEKNVALLRVEQLYPFPEVRISKLLTKYATAKDICWVQEEPKNMGAWTFIAPYLIEQLTGSQKLIYIGRKASASPATGFAKKHEAEQNAIIDETFSL